MSCKIYSALKLQDQLVNKRLQDVLIKKVVGVPSRKVDVKALHQQARHEDLVLIQPAHGNIQRLTGVGVVGAKRSETKIALDDGRGS